MTSAVLLEIKFATFFSCLEAVQVLIEASKHAPLYTKTPKSHQTNLVATLNMFTHFHIFSKSNTSYFGSQ